jgi:hypothetical protein
MSAAAAGSPNGDQAAVVKINGIVAFANPRHLAKSVTLSPCFMPFLATEVGRYHRRNGCGPPSFMR